MVCENRAWEWRRASSKTGKMGGEVLVAVGGADGAEEAGGRGAVERGDIDDPVEAIADVAVGALP